MADWRVVKAPGVMPVQSTKMSAARLGSEYRTTMTASRESGRRSDRDREIRSKGECMGILQFVRRGRKGGRGAPPTFADWCGFLYVPTEIWGLRAGGRGF